MKTLHLYILIAMLLPAIAFSQKETAHQSPTINKIDSNQDPKAHLREVSLRMTKAWDSDQPAEVISIVDSEIPGCSTQPDSVFCKAAIWYTGGYLFQTGFEQNDSMADNYKGIAASYYRRVLEILPENQDALSNMIRLYEHSAPDVQTIKLMEKLAEEYPTQRINYLLRIGDIYLQQKDPLKANSYYEKAYEEDPWSEPACSRLVNLYVQHGLFYGVPQEKYNANATSDFIYDCQEIGLPNFSEDVARQQVIYKLNKQGLTKEELIGSLLVWIDILAENNWLEQRRMEDLRIPYFEKNSSLNAMASLGNQILGELVDITLAKETSQVKKDGFWFNNYTTVKVPGKEDVTTRFVLLKILNAIGEKSYFSGDLVRAEQFWQLGFETANFENVLFTVFGKELAQLYMGAPKLDPYGDKLKKLVGELFHGKMNSYLASNTEMIREYHTVLGVIYYDQKKFTGGQYTNAEFQLQHALDPKLGPIINPELRMMLVEVYGANKDSFNMMNENIRAIMDMLRLDRMEEAKKMIVAAEVYAHGNLKNFNTKLGALGKIRKFRSACADADATPFENQAAVYQFLRDVKEKETQAITILEPWFVKEQNFKALSDAGQRIPNAQTEWQQQVYSQALMRIADSKELGSYEDYNRLQRIRQSLSTTLDQPGVMATERFNKEAKINYKASGPGVEYKTFVIPSLDREIQIPQSLFQLNQAVTEYYTPKTDVITTTTMMPKIRYQDKTYSVIKASELQKNELNQPAYQKFIPVTQKKPLPEKEILQMKSKVH
jgi:tetratricopeptide (TPR) repeat protein